MPAQPLVRDDAQRVDVGLRRGLFALRLLGGDVLRGADDHAILRDLLLVRGVGDAEIGDFHLARSGDHDVGRLDVAVDHAVAVRHEQAARGLDQYRQQFRRGQRATVAVDVGQRVAGHVLHDEEADAIVLVILEQRGDVGVRQIGGIVRFRPQTVQLGLDVALIVAQRLDGDGTVELDVVAFPHLSHAALRQSAIQAVTAVDELSFDEFHCFRASSISERMIGPAASTPY